MHHPERRSGRPAGLAWRRAINFSLMATACLLASLTSAESTRVIDDAALGRHWKLMPNAVTPGGPGRLVEVDGDQAESASKPLVIRSGDHIVLEHETSNLKLRMSGRALEAARMGAPLRIRLDNGGRVMEVVATGEDRVDLKPAMRAAR